MKRSRIVWGASQVLAAVAAYALFFALVPWIASQPIAEVPPAVAQVMPAGCPAVFENHAAYSCFWAGPLSAHPGKAVLIAAGFLLALGVLVVPSLTGRGLDLRRRHDQT